MEPCTSFVTVKQQKLLCLVFNCSTLMQCRRSLSVCGILYQVVEKFEACLLHLHERSRTRQKPLTAACKSEANLTLSQKTKISLALEFR